MRILKKIVAGFGAVAIGASALANDTHATGTVVGQPPISNNGELFDWRDYIVLQPVAPLSADRVNQPSWQHARGRNQIVHDQLENVLEQISMIPEVQSLMRQAKSVRGGKIPLRTYANSQSNIASYDKPMPGLPQGLLNVGVNLPSALFMTSDGKQFRQSLQTAIIHEIKHSADPNDNEKLELKHHAEAAERSIEKFLRAYPDYAANYRQFGTIEASPFRAWASAPTIGAKDDLESKLPRLSTFFKASSETELEAATRRYISQNPNFPRGDAYASAGDNVGAYILNHYQFYKELAVTRDVELPAVQFTASISRRYFPDEPTRDGYGAIKGNRHDYEAMTLTEVKALWGGITHQDIPQGVELAPTKLCPKPTACTARRISGTGYKPY